MILNLKLFQNVITEHDNKQNDICKAVTDWVQSQSHKDEGC